MLLTITFTYNLIMQTISKQRCFGGIQGVYRHDSKTTACPMNIAVFVPPGEGLKPVVWYLSGLTSSEQNVILKSGMQRYASELGLIVVAPDTSPRDTGIPDEDAREDFGSGAGFYVDATVAPWAKHYRMRSYIAEELPGWLGEHFPADLSRQSITGHSMGGHGALTLGLKYPQQYRSISAFAPICAPARCAWGCRAFTGYLGEDTKAWRDYDATSLMEDGHRREDEILIDQGDADEFLKNELMSDAFVAACEQAGQKLNYRLREGYDHGYFFVSSFIGEHLAWHAARLA